MTRHLASLTVLPFVFWLAATWDVAPSRAEQPATLTIAAANSLREALKDVLSLFEDQHKGLTVRVVYGPSQTLREQIEQGSPADVYLPSSIEEIERLEKKGLIVSQPTIYGTSSLVLITAHTTTIPISSAQDLRKQDIRRIAIGNPQTSSVGKFAAEFLVNSKLTQELRKRIVYGEHSGAVLDLVAKGEADVGLVYRTDAVHHRKVRIVAETPAGSHQPVVYGLAAVWTVRNSPSCVNSEPLWYRRRFKRCCENMALTNPKPTSTLLNGRRIATMNRTERVTSWAREIAVWGLTGLLIALGGIGTVGCTSKAPVKITATLEEGRDVVRLEQAPNGGPYSHPVQLTPNEIKTLLRGVRTWERRNVIHELLLGEADKTRAFRDDEIATLAPVLSKALAQAKPTDRVFFHLSRPTESGDEETTTGWVYIQGPILHLVLSEVHDIHGPQPDIGKYDRQMPNIPEVAGPFNVTFEPEEYLVKVTSAGPWFSPEQQEDLQIEFRKALPVSPPQVKEPKP